MTTTANMPDQTVDEAPDYKNNIDATMRVLAEIAANFAAHEAATPNMTVLVDAGKLWDGLTHTTKAQQTSAAFTAPITNPRIDRIAIDTATGNLVVVAGTEAASPVAPSYSSTHYPVCQVALVVSQTSIVNADITDERSLINGVSGIISGNTFTEKQLAATHASAYEADFSNGSVFEVTMTGNVAVTFANIPITTLTTTATFILKHSGAARTPSFPASVLWDGGTTPTWGTASGNEDIVTMFTYDGGTTWRANLVGQNYA